jgi:polysaccharide export outer membrane protein
VYLDAFVENARLGASLSRMLESVSDGAKLCRAVRVVDRSIPMASQAGHIKDAGLRHIAALVLACALHSSLGAQSTTPTPATSPPPPPAAPGQSQTAAGVHLPADYVIGAEDMLDVVFWTAKEMSHQVLVRPDGKISLPLIGDIDAAGLTPERLAVSLKKAAEQFVRDGDVTVIVTEIHSRKVYVVGEVSKPGTITLGSEMTVLQALGEAGGFLEGASKGNVTIVRNEAGGARRFTFNYNDVVRGKNVQQNIKLLPGDTILVR